MLDFLLAADDVSLAAESGLAAVSDFALDFFLLALDLPAVDEVSLAESEPVVASDFALFVDFLLEELLVLEAADGSSVLVVSFLDFFFLLVPVDEVDWSVVDVLWVCANAGATTNPNTRHTPAAQVSTLIRSVLIPIPSL